MSSIWKYAMILFALLIFPTLSFAQVDPYLTQKQDEIYRPSVTVETEEGMGTGVVIYSKAKSNGEVDTYILTNYHVVKDAVDDKMIVNVGWLQHDKEFREIGTLRKIARVFEHDEAHDMALLQLNDRENRVPYVAHIAPIGVKLQIMEHMWTVGNTHSEPLLASEGMLASMDVYMPGDIRFMRTQMYANLGNSGGGSFHYDPKRGYELVGLVTAIAMHRVSVKNSPVAQQKVEDAKIVKMKKDGNISYSLPPEVVQEFLKKVGKDHEIDFFHNAR